MRLRAKSPVQLIHGVKCDVLMLLGQGDRRVVFHPSRIASRVGRLFVVTSRDPAASIDSLRMIALFWSPLYYCHPFPASALH